MTPILPTRTGCWFSLTACRRLGKTRTSRKAADLPPLLLPDPPLHVLLQHRHRHRAAAEDGFVEAAEVELRAELLLGLAAQLPDLARSHLVGERLAGDVRRVAERLGADLGARFEGVRLHVFDRLLALPAEGVHAGIHHQA